MKKSLKFESEKIHKILEMNSRKVSQKLIRLTKLLSESVKVIVVSIDVKSLTFV